MAGRKGRNWRRAGRNEHRRRTIFFFTFFHAHFPGAMRSLSSIGGFPRVCEVVAEVINRFCGEET